MAEKMISREEFELVYNKCRDYDPWTCMIDSYRQAKSAEKANERIMQSLKEMLAKFDIEFNFIPYGVDCGNTDEVARISLIEYFNKHDVRVEDPEKIMNPDKADEPAKEATEQTTKRTWTEEEIKDLIQTNDKVLYGALKKLYAEQTADEQADGQTSHVNGAGFNGVDSPFLSSCSEFLIKKGYLTDKQKASVRKLLVKYNKQLTRLANE